jgi:anthranilate phosphoribosyltransferase
MEFYGYTFSSEPDKLRRELDETGICFLHAPLFNPAMKNVAPVRKSLRMKTFFNMLGPMVNPSSPKSQLIGVFSLDVARLYNYIYQEGDTNFTILHSLDGYDEISLTGPFKIYTRDYERTFQPKEAQVSPIQPEQIYGGESVEESSRIFLDVLEGKGTRPQQDAVIVNAAFALQTLHPEYSLEDAVGRSRESLESGNALKAFKKLMELQK